MNLRDKLADRRPSHGTPAPTPTPRPGRRPSFGTPTPTPTPTPLPGARPSIDYTEGYDGSQPFNIPLDEFLQDPDSVGGKMQKREEFMRGTPTPAPTPLGGLDPEGLNVASAKIGATPEDEDKMAELMRDYDPQEISDLDRTPSVAAQSASSKLLQKMNPTPTPEPTPTPNIRPSLSQLRTPTPTPASKSYDDQLVQELLGKRGK